MDRLVITLFLALSLVASTSAHAQGEGYDTIYRGTAAGRTIQAISVQQAHAPARLDDLVTPIATSASVVLVYINHQRVTEATPHAVYEGGERTAYTEAPAATSTWNTIRQETRSAYVSGGRTGAVCEDGWRSSATGRGACSHHGGVAYWTHARYRDTDAVVATICVDHRLVAGGGSRCREAGTLAQVKNKSY